MTLTDTRRSLTVRPDRLRQFGDPAGGAFCLMTNAGLAARVAVDGGDAANGRTVVLDEVRPFARQLREDTPEGAHVLVISPDRLIVSPPPAEVGRRKLLVMPCNSTPTSDAVIARAIEAAERADPTAQEAFAERFFARAEAAGTIELVDETHGARAVFRHLDGDYHWNQQAGPLAWGEQQVAPGGELSVLPAGITEFRPERRFALDGEIALSGRPVLHAGLASFLREDQARIHGALSGLETHAAVARVEGGIVTGLRATGAAAGPAVAMLEAMFRVDARYRVVWELGFGINTALEPLEGNVAVNEVFGGSAGVFHVGLGLTPFTQYALIVLCPTTRALAGGAELVGGVRAPAPGRRRLAVRRDGGGCGCRS